MFTKENQGIQLEKLDRVDLPQSRTFYIRKYILQLCIDTQMHTCHIPTQSIHFISEMCLECWIYHQYSTEFVDQNTICAGESPCMIRQIISLSIYIHRHTHTYICIHTYSITIPKIVKKNQTSFILDISDTLNCVRCLYMNQISFRQDSIPAAQPLGETSIEVAQENDLLQEGIPSTEMSHHFLELWKVNWDDVQGLSQGLVMSHYIPITIP